jgi:hypothetical protein
MGIRPTPQIKALSYICGCIFVRYNKHEGLETTIHYEYSWYLGHIVTMSSES